MKPSRLGISWCRACLLAAVLSCLGSAGLLARDDPFALPNQQAPVEKDYVPQYFIVGMFLAMGIFIICRPARRNPEIPHEFVVSGAAKDTKNI